jgi:hypothetical protein
MRERGNVLFYILIGVSLLASLVYAVSQSGRGSVQQVNAERTRLLASEITDFANTVATAYAQIRLRGCKIDQVSFQNPLIAAYDNPGAPTDQTCDIFELAGGGVTLKNPPAEAGVNGGGTPVQLFTIEAEIEEIGSTCGDENCTELLLVSGPLKKDVCMQINDSIGIDNPSGSPPRDNAAFAGMAKYTGALSYKTVIGDEVTSAAVKLKNAACIEDTDDSNFYFYKVLTTR